MIELVAAMPAIRGLLRGVERWGRAQAGTAGLRLPDGSLYAERPGDERLDAEKAYQALAEVSPALAELAVPLRRATTKAALQAALVAAGADAHAAMNILRLSGALTRGTEWRSE